MIQDRSKRGARLDMVSFGSRRGEAGAGAMPLMVAAFLSAAGLLYWLSVNAAPVGVEVVEGVPVVNEIASTRVPINVFGTDPMAQAGKLIELPGLVVLSHVGPEAFFVQVPNQPSPYLARILPAVVADGVVVEDGATVSLTGRVYTMSDSVADSWVAGGGITEGNRILATFAESFFEAEEVTVTAEPRPGVN